MENFNANKKSNRFMANFYFAGTIFVILINLLFFFICGERWAERLLAKALK